MKRCAFFISGITVALVSMVSVQAEVPGKINYSGKLTTVQGQLADGIHDFSFALYQTPTGGAGLWSEAHPTVVVSNGAFHVVLGSTNSLSTVFQDYDTLFLEVSVDGDTLTPRQEMLSVGYALNAVSGTSVPAGGIIIWSGSSGNIPQGWALCDGTNGTPDLRDRFVVGAGGSHTTGDTGGSATVDLAHSHSVDGHTHSLSNHTHSLSSHTHSLSNHTHSIPSHSHGNGSLYACWNMLSNYVYYRGVCGVSWTPGYRFYYSTWGTTSSTQTCGIEVNGSTASWSGTSGSGGGGNTGSGGNGTTGSGGGGTTGSSAPGTDTQLGSSVENRPPYYALAYIMKL